MEYLQNAYEYKLTVRKSTFQILKGAFLIVSLCKSNVYNF